MSEPTTDEPQDAYIAALQRERAGYQARGLDDRVKAVDAELKRLGVTRAQAHKGAERAVTSPAERRKSS